MIWLIGLPSGSLDLISIKALTLLKNCKLCICPQSLLNNKLLSYCNNAVSTFESLKWQLEHIMYAILCTNGLVVKLHSGSLFGYSGVNELSFYLKSLGKHFTVLPSIGVLDTVFSYLGCEFDSTWSRTMVITRLTKKGIVNNKLFCSQTLFLLRPLAVVYLSIRLIPFICKVLRSSYGPFCPVVCVYKSTWHTETYLLSNIGSLNRDIKSIALLRMVLLVIGRNLLGRSLTSCKLIGRLT